MDLHTLFSTASSETPLDLQKFGVAIALSALGSGLLALFYVKFGTSPSNRKIFARQFMPLTLATMIVISIIQSSLALSLGLVGALSIVRFRAAIKEPEELIYLFICITLGLGFGASQFALTTLGLLTIVLILLLQSILKPNMSKTGLILSISSANAPSDLAKRVTDQIEKYTDRVDLRRLSHGEVTEAVFVIQPNSKFDPDELMSGICKLMPEARLSLLEQREVY